MKKIRAFIAISLPTKVARALGQVNQILAEQVPPKSVRWVTPERMHLTLRFLGNIDEAKVAAIATELDKVAAEQRAFTLHLDELGTFPNRKRPRVIWVGLKGEEDQLQVLRKAVDAGLVPLGWEPEDRPFRAHLTLGRVKDARKLRGVEWGTEVESLDVPVTAVHLIQSQLRPSGPIYTVRHTSQLRQ